MNKQTTFTIRKNLLFIALMCFSFLKAAEFTPGEGGALPTFSTFTNLPNKFGGFRVDYISRIDYYFGGGPRTTVDMGFPEPATIGASSYTLQYSTNGSSWSNYQSGYTDLTTTGDNFSITLEENYYLRVLANGGPKNGYTSNEVYTPLSSIDTYFGGYSMDESMYISGIMSPWAGRGIKANFTVKKLSDATIVNNCLTYQWYRINPLTYEESIIPGADRLTYITTAADAGYKLMIKATADGINAGGFCSIITEQGNYIANKSYASNVNKDGFTLNLFKTVNSLSIQDLVLRDKDYNPVTVTNLTQGTNAAIYHITASLDPTKAPYQLEYKSDFWKIASTFMMTHLMPFLNITFDIPTEINTIETSTTIFPNPTSDIINIQSDDIIKEVDLISINGEVVKNIVADSDNIAFNVSTLSPGWYILHINTENAIITRKIEIKR